MFFRLGDFYEMFDDDALTGSRELELTLTSREFARGERSPMCGVPYHAAEHHIARLVARGYKVAICEQIGDPRTAKGLVEREVVRVVTPGTTVEPALLDPRRNRYLAAAMIKGDEGKGMSTYGSPRLARTCRRRARHAATAWQAIALSADAPG